MKTKIQIIFLAFAGLVLVGGIIETRNNPTASVARARLAEATPADNRRLLQGLIDALPNLGNAPEGMGPTAGVARVPSGKFVLDEPLKLKPGVVLDGEGAGATILENPNGPVVLFHTDAGNNYVSNERVQEMTLRAGVGDAVALSTTADESNALEIRDCQIIGDVNLVAATGRASYFATIRDTRWRERGQIRFAGQMLKLERVQMVINQARPFLVSKSGNGSVRDCWFEGPATLVDLANGSWVWESTHNEPHGPDVAVRPPQMVFTNARVVADQIYFVLSNRHEIHLRQGSKLYFTRQLSAENGDRPEMFGAIQDPAKCYKTDGATEQRRDLTNKLMFDSLGRPQMINANQVWFNGVQQRTGKLAA